MLRPVALLRFALVVGRFGVQVLAIRGTRRRAVNHSSSAFSFSCSLIPAPGTALQRRSSTPRPFAIAIAMTNSGSFRDRLTSMLIDIRGAASGRWDRGFTGAPRSGDEVFIRFNKEMRQDFALPYTKKLKHKQKDGIIAELAKAVHEARRLKDDGKSEEDIVQELEVRRSLSRSDSAGHQSASLLPQKTYSAEAIRKHLVRSKFALHTVSTDPFREQDLPPFGSQPSPHGPSASEHSNVQHSEDEPSAGPLSEEALGTKRRRRSAAADEDAPRYKRTGHTPPPDAAIDPRTLFGSSHSLSKPRWRPSDSVPGYGESWTARKAAIYGMSL